MADLHADQRRKSSIGTLEIQNRDGTVRTVDAENMTDADRALAAEFGYQPVFKREFGYLSTFSFAVSISGLFSTIATTFSFPLTAGGSSSAVFSWLISGAGCMCIALSVSELVSAYPTCGGLYYTVSRLLNRKWTPSVSWVVGWLNILGQIAGVASSEWGAAELLLAAVSIGINSSKSHTPGQTVDTTSAYTPTIGQTVGVMAGLTVLTGLVNSLSTYWMEKMTKSYVIFHIIILVACSITLLAMTTHERGHPKHTSKYVFTSTYNDSGWSPAGWSWMFGFLSVSWTMTDYDATAHITEEIKEPELKAPWAISMAMLFTYLGGFLFNIVLCYTMGEPKEVLGSAFGQPVVQIFLDAMGPAGAIVFAVGAFIIIKFVCFTAMQALARTVFAFSRDRLLPFPHLWTKILPMTGTPILAVWVSVFWCIAINLIGLGSDVAIEGVFNVTAIALDWSYCIPIVCKIFSTRFVPGPWQLGKFGTVVNVYACLWTFFVTIIFLMPDARPVKANNMNYAVAYLGGILLFSTIYWYAQGRKFYTGPLVEAEFNEEIVDAERSSDDDEVAQKKRDAPRAMREDV